MLIRDLDQQSGSDRQGGSDRRSGQSEFDQQGGSDKGIGKSGSDQQGGSGHLSSTCYYPGSDKHKGIWPPKWYLLLAFKNLQIPLDLKAVLGAALFSEKVLKVCNCQQKWPKTPAF